MPFPNGYSYRATVTVDRTKVPSTQTGFPFLIFGTYSDFKTVSHSGKVQNTTTINSQIVPTDLIVTDLSSTLLSWEVATYDSTTGSIEIWVNCTLSSSVNSQFYIYYGKLSVTTYQCTYTAAWDSHYQGVYHLAVVNTVSGAVKDSTTNLRSGTGHGTVSGAVGKISGAAQFSTTTNGNDIENMSRPIQDDFTISFWIKTTLVGNTGPNFFQLNGLVDAEVAGVVNDFSVGLKVNNIGFGVGNPDTTINGTFVVNDGNWHYVVVTRIKSTGAMKIYVDSFSTPDATGTGNTNSLTSSTSVHFGGIPAGPAGTNFVGEIDEVEFSDIVRSADYLTTQYNNQNSPSAFYTIVFGSILQKSTVMFN